MLGENAIRFLGLDRARLADIASRIGPTVEEIKGSAEVRPESSRASPLAAVTSSLLKATPTSQRSRA